MSKRQCDLGFALSQGRCASSAVFSTVILILLASNGLAQREDSSTVLTFRVGASVGRDGACAGLYEQTAKGYQFFFDALAHRHLESPLIITDTTGRNFTIRLKFRLISHNCTDAGRTAALSYLINGGRDASTASSSSPSPPQISRTTPTATFANSNAGTSGGSSGGGAAATADDGDDDGPVHLLLGGNGNNAQDDALQANAASRLLLHCCAARDSVYLLDLPYVYGLFTPASMYTGAILRTMAFSGLRRVAVAFTVNSELHVQLCSGALRQMVPLAELRPGFGPAVALNYTAEASMRPGFWEETGGCTWGTAFCPA